MIRLSLLLFACLLALPSAVAQSPNLLVMIGDDMGVDSIGCYQRGTNPPPTPNLDALAANGIRFTRATACPTCSPTRACIQTGRYPFRTGVGFALGAGAQGLQASEVILPEVLAGSGYGLAMVGKWHLGNAQGAATPNLAGWPHYVGNLQGVLPSYTSWQKVTNGTTALETAYATTETVDEALAWLAGRPEPWCLMVCFNAAHTPLHEPPAGLHTYNLGGLNPNTTPVPFFKAMVQSMDSEIGRLLTGIGGATLANTNVVFVGDNGTTSQTTRAPFIPGHGKGTLYQGGVEVPLLVQGPAVVRPGRVSDALVDGVDLFVTMSALCGVDARATVPANVPLDGMDLRPLLADTATLVRSFSYTEQFGSTAGDGQAIAASRYKLIRFDAGTMELYDLPADPFEQNDLLAGTLSASAAAALVDLQVQLAMLRGEALATAFGTACTGLPATLAPMTGAPTPGDPHLVRATTTVAGVVAAFGALGFSNDEVAGQPLPLSLATYGAPGCELWVSLDAFVGITLGPTAALWNEVIPNSGVLLGLPFYQQVLLAAPGVNIAGVLVSNALACVIGP
ncbi:MAG: sulfatase-like hydrolase/transferase [Planctomycetes bacterium]|nr:sulfatase-like hydrolase/transferase [Planctomycetota bacterium]